MAITNATLATALNDLIAYWSSFSEEYATWLAGSVGGGPNLDGDYPLTDYEGNTTLVACPAQLQDDVSNLVTGAAGHKTAAEVAQTAAEVAQAAAELAETGSVAARDAALTYRDAALAAQTAAESARTTAIAQAGVATNNAGYAQEWAITVEDTLVSVAAGGNGTTDYSSLHHAAKASASASAASLSETNAAASESAAAASAAAAATFDPALYAALADDETVTGNYQFTNGLAMGTQVAATATDLSLHLALYSNIYGMNVTSAAGGTMNLVRSGVAQIALSPSLTTVAGALTSDGNITGLTVRGTDGVNISRLDFAGVFTDRESSYFRNENTGASAKVILQSYSASGQLAWFNAAGQTKWFVDINGNMEADGYVKGTNFQNLTGDYAFMVGGTRETGFDIDTQITDGIYKMNSAASHNATPGSMGYGTLQVIDNLDVHSQVYIAREDDGRMFVRCKTTTDFAGGGWNRMWSDADFANNSANWNTAYGWGDHASGGYAPLAAPSFTGGVTADGLVVNGNTDLTGSVDIIDATNGNTHFNYAGGHNYVTHKSTGFTRWRSFVAPGTYTTHMELGVNGLTLSGVSGTTYNFTLTGDAPTIKFNDTDASADDFWIHVNNNNFYVLRDNDDNNTWDSPHPLQLEADTNKAYIFGQEVMTASTEGGSYYGMAYNGSHSGYMRTTTLGLIPYTASNTSVIGTTSWPFASAAFKYAVFTGGVDTPVQFQNVNVVGAPNGTIGNDILHVGYQVKGGSYDATGSTYTGYCRIRFPISTTNDSSMMTMMIHGYNYSGTKGQGDGGAWCIQVGGYFYSTENWHNTSARVVSGSPPFDRVYFGEDETGDYKYLLLGTSTTQWDYPKVWLTDLTGGHSTQYTDWLNGTWNIDFSASTPSNWSGDAGSSPIYLGGQIRWDGENGSIAASKNLGGRLTISTSAASGGYDGDIHFKY